MVERESSSEVAQLKELVREQQAELGAQRIELNRERRARQETTAQIARLERSLQTLTSNERQQKQGGQNAPLAREGLSRATMLRAAGVAAVATLGVSTLIEKTAKPADAAAGYFDADGLDNSAVTAIGTNHAIGVNASSDTGYGVYGYSRDFPGVQGSSVDSYGVEGVSVNSGGVFGITDAGTGVTGRTDGPDAAGVYGFHTSNTGFGVLGRSYADPSQTTLGSGSGIYGESGYGYGVGGHAVDGTGVSGQSDKGIGVRGGSVDGYGSEFQGGRSALRIVPTRRVGPPAAHAHQRGELLVDAKGNLFLCMAAGTPGRWKQVVVK